MTIFSGLSKIAHVLTSPVRLMTTPLDMAVQIAKGDNVGKVISGGLVQAATLGLKAPNGSLADAPLKAIGLDPDTAQNQAAAATLQAQINRMQAILSRPPPTMTQAQLNAIRTTIGVQRNVLTKYETPKVSQNNSPSPTVAPTPQTDLASKVISSKTIEVGAVIASVVVSGYLLLR